jgi:hypothetical protein
MRRLFAATVGLGLLVAAGTVSAAPVRPIAEGVPHPAVASDQITPVRYDPYYRHHYAPPRHWQHHRPHWRSHSHWRAPHAYGHPHTAYRPYTYQYGWR